MATLARALGVLLGISAYAAPASSLPSLDSPRVEAMREKLGGQLSTLPTTRLRWYVADLERAMLAADAGDLGPAAQLCAAIRRDGVLAGVLSTRTNGIVGLPKRFTGRADIVACLEGRNGVRSVFDDMFPPAELAMFGADGVLLGVAVGELVPVEGRDYPVFVRLEPEYLRYRWNENRWYYQSIVGLLPITPGDGRWVLHIDGGRVSPWRAGLWHALGQAWIDKQHARLYKSNWEAKLANPARVAVSPQGASEMQRQTWFQKVMAWGVNSVFGLTPGYDVKLLESNGRGYESFQATIEGSHLEYIIAIAGQMVTVTGGAGFSNADVHKSIRADLIKATADNLAYTINTQGIPPFVLTRFGEEALAQTAVLEWDTKPPKDLEGVAKATSAFGLAVQGANAALLPYGLQVDAAEMAQQFGITVRLIPPPVAPTPADVALDEGEEVELTEDDLEMSEAA